MGFAEVVDMMGWRGGKQERRERGEGSGDGGALLM